MDHKELNDTLKSVSADLSRVSDDLSTKAEAAMAEAKNAGELSATTKAEVDDLLTKHTEATNKVEGITARLEEIEKKSVRNGPDTEPRKSVGAQAVESEAFQGLDSSKVQANTRYSAPVRNALLSSGVAADVVEPERMPGIQSDPRQRLFIRDLISVGRTTAPAIFWVQQTGFTNNAAVVPEGTLKPESTIAFETKTTPVVTIAHLFKASKQILDDFTQLQSTVDDEMRYGLAYAEEQEILFGAGGGGNIEGIVPQATAFAPEFAPDARTQIDDVRLAMLQTHLARLPATGIVLHTIDWAKMTLTKDADGRHLIGNPQGTLSPSLWGLPVVETDIPSFEGNLLVGAFKGGAMFFVREEANVVIATTNNDDFEKNMITIRCEERGALAVKRPEAFVYGAFGAAVAA